MSQKETAQEDGKLISHLKRIRPLVTVVKGTQKHAGLIVRPALISRYMKTHSLRKLQIGAYVCMMPGWLNTDLYPQSLSSVTLDATKTFPLPDTSFDYVFSEHQLEHIEYEGAVTMFKECHRILRSGGKIRIAIPSLEPLLQLFGSTRTDLQERYIRRMTGFAFPEVKDVNPCFAINAVFTKWGHRFIYDKTTLGNLLKTIGFTNIQFFTPGESDDSNLSGLETRTLDTDAYETMIIQAVRS